MGWLPLRSLVLYTAALAGVVSNDSFGSDTREDCLEKALPRSRVDFPAFLNCLGLTSEAVEVGVQAGVHASSFLGTWRGSRLRLVDAWSASVNASGSHLFYVDIAKIHDPDVPRQHRAHCEARLAEDLRTGRAEILPLDSAAAAAQIRDRELDFVYLDARHDFAGVVTDIHAWWPKVKVGGIFAGHDFVDGEFPEGDFLWISALREVLPEVQRNHTYVTQEHNRYPSFFVLKTEELADVSLRSVEVEPLTRRYYAEFSKYFALWRKAAAEGLERTRTAVGDRFLPLCGELCGKACDERALGFTPTRTPGSTLRPFACGASDDDSPRTERSKGSDTEAQATMDACLVDMDVDVKRYHSVCIERCNVTCKQRAELFSTFGDEIMTV